MKNDQKNPFYPYVLVSCMKNQLIHAEYGKTHYGIYKRLNLEMHLNLWFKWTSNQVNISCISSAASHLHAMFMHHIAAYDCVLIAGTVPSR